MQDAHQRSIAQRKMDRASIPQWLMAQQLKERLMAAVRRPGGAGAYAMPTVARRTKSEHHVHTWTTAGRQKLVARAISLGVLVTGKTPEVIGKPGKGQFRSWKTLAAAVERAERRGTYADEVVAAIEADIPAMRDHLRKALDGSAR
jgi:hypothetical protein